MRVGSGIEIYRCRALRHSRLRENDGASDRGVYFTGTHNSALNSPVTGSGTPSAA